MSTPTGYPRKHCSYHKTSIPGSFLRDDNGQLALEHGHSVMWDYTNKAGVALFARALVNVVNQTLSNGAPVLDYLFLDGPDWQPVANISVARNARIRAAKMTFFADLQNQFDALPGGQHQALLNGVDNVDTAKLFNPTGAGGATVWVGVASTTTQAYFRNKSVLYLFYFLFDLGNKNTFFG